MSEYLITKRDKCPACQDRQPPETFPCLQCSMKGYIDTSVGLLEVLSKVRFTPVDIVFQETAETYTKPVFLLANVRIEE